MSHRSLIEQAAKQNESLKKSKVYQSYSLIIFCCSNLISPVTDFIMCILDEGMYHLILSLNKFHFCYWKVLRYQNLYLVFLFF